jgi:hypothetical protein
MRSPAAAEYLDRVALLTGELFVTTQLTTAGDIPRLSASGTYASYQNSVNDSPVTSIIRLGQKPEKIAELPTGNIAFDAGGKRLAWIRFVKSGDATATEIVVRDLATGQDAVWLGPGMTKSDLKWSAQDDAVLFLGSTSTDRSDVFRVRAGQAPEVLTPEPGRKSNLVIDSAGRTLIYTEGGAGAGGGRGGGAPGRAGGAGAGGAGATGAAGAGAAGARPRNSRAGATPPTGTAAAGGATGGAGGIGGWRRRWTRESFELRDRVAGQQVHAQDQRICADAVGGWQHRRVD